MKYNFKFKEKLAGFMGKKLPGFMGKEKLAGFMGKEKH